MLAIPMVRGGIVRIQLNSALIFSLGAQPIPVISSFGIRQRNACFGESTIDPESFFRRCFHLRHYFIGSEYAVEPKDDVGIGQTSMGKRVVRIYANGFFKKLYALFHPFIASLI